RPRRARNATGDFRTVLRPITPPTETARRLSRKRPDVPTYSPASAAANVPSQTARKTSPTRRVLNSNQQTNASGAHAAGKLGQRGERAEGARRRGPRRRRASPHDLERGQLQHHGQEVAADRRTGQEARLRHERQARQRQGDGPAAAQTADDAVQLEEQD